MTADPVSLAWLLALAVTVHNVEEMIWLPSFEGSLTPASPPAVPFRVAAAFITLLFWLAAAALAAGWLIEGVVAGFAFSMAVNAVIPHAVVTVLARQYHPGTLTGLLLNVPAGLAYLVSVDAFSRLTDWAFMSGALGGVAALIAVLAILAWVSKRLRAPARLS